MAGIAGKSGGPRKNSGGVRRGAGRPKKAAVMIDLGGAVAGSVTYEDPKLFLLAVMNNSTAEIKLRVEAARALMPYTHSKKGEAGKKEEKSNAAKVAGSGKFSPTKAPWLVVDNEIRQ